MPREQSPARATRPGQHVIDAWVSLALREMAIAMGNWIIESEIDQTKPIRLLSLPDLQGLAWVAQAKYSDLREVERKRFDISLFDEKTLDDMGFVIDGNSS